MITIPYELESAMRSEGIAISGNLRETKTGFIRFDVDGDKPNSQNGWIRFFGDGANFGSFKLGISASWFDSGAVKVSKKEIQQRNAARQKEQAISYADAAKKAVYIFNKSIDIDCHQYLTKKGILNHGLKSYKGALVVPIFNNCGKLTSLQFIDNTGCKRFLSGGEIDGCYSIIGWRKCGIVVICEGWATGATIHEATGLPVVVAFNSANLPKVAKNIRLRTGNRVMIIIAADNDKNLSIRRPDIGNIGIKKGYEAASISRGHLLYPIFSESESGSDFNDLGKIKTAKIFKRIV